MSIWMFCKNYKLLYRHWSVIICNMQYSELGMKCRDITSALKKLKLKKRNLHCILETLNKLQLRDLWYDKASKRDSSMKFLRL